MDVGHRPIGIIYVRTCALNDAAAIRTTGNVYSYEALDELCFKPKNYKVWLARVCVQCTRGMHAVHGEYMQCTGDMHAVNGC